MAEGIIEDHCCSDEEAEIIADDPQKIREYINNLL